MRAAPEDLPPRAPRTRPGVWPISGVFAARGRESAWLPRGVRSPTPTALWKIAPASLPGEVLVARKERGESLARCGLPGVLAGASPTPKGVWASKVCAMCIEGSLTALSPSPRHNPVGVGGAGRFPRVARRRATLGYFPQRRWRCPADAPQKRNRGLRKAPGNWPTSGRRSSRPACRTARSNSRIIPGAG